MHHLQKLTLHHNEFTGSVPAEVCQLRNPLYWDGNLHFLWVDCSPVSRPSTNLMAPSVFCPEDCCTICFEGYNTVDGAATSSPHKVQGDAELTLKQKLMAASSDKGAALMDVGTPQFQAYAWLVHDSSEAGVEYSSKRQVQRYGLATLYFATDGAQWRESKNWVTSVDECTCYGIDGCDDANTGEIVTLALRNNRLAGELPPEIFEFLPNVVQFNIATNQVSGPIPPEIGLLQSLDILELAENRFTSIPAEMGQLTTVDHIFMQSNAFVGKTMPPEVCDLRTSHSLTLLWADCKGDPAGFECGKACCTTCFTGDVFGSDGDNVYGPAGTGIGGTDAVTHADPADEVLK